MAWGPSRIEQIPDIKRIIVAPAVTGGPQTAAKHHPPRWLVFFAAWRSRFLLIISGRVVLWRTDVRFGLSHDVGVDAETGRLVPVHDRVLRRPAGSGVDLRAAASRL